MRVVVIGAGILGSSVAYHLARKGIEVEIVDEGHPRQGDPGGRRDRLSLGHQGD